MKEKELKLIIKEVVKECISNRKTINEAGLTSEEGKNNSTEEVRLVKSLQLIAKKLIDLHKDDTALDENKDKWIQKAVNPKHKGYCTPMTKSTCTPERKALAKRFKRGLEEISENCDDYFKDCGAAALNNSTSPEIK